MRALVTGATGFIGRHVVKALLERGDSVRLLARTEQRASPFRSTTAQIVIGDLARPDTIGGIANGIDVVFHLGSAMSAARPDFEGVDVRGTAWLLGEAERAGVRRFVYAGTLSAYPLAQKHDGAVIDELCSLDTTGLLGHYARSKARAEEIVRDAARHGGVECVIVRLGLVCGLGTAVFPAHVCQVIAPNLLLMFGDGGIPVPLTFIDNAVDALVLAATVEGIAGESFNIVDDNDILTQQQYLDLYRQSTGSEPRLLKLPRITYYILGAFEELLAATRHREPKTTRYRVRTRLRRVRWDCSKAHRVLRWQPRISLRVGLTRAFKAHTTGTSAAERTGS